MLENHLAALATLLHDRMQQAFGALSPSAAAILLSLRNRGALPVSRAAAIVGIAQPTAGRLIDGLERDRLVKRGPRDGRQITVGLTTRGRRTAERLQTARCDLVADLLAPLGRQQRRQLAGLADSLLYAATSGRTEARTTCRYCDHGRCGGERCPVDRRATALERDARGDG